MIHNMEMFRMNILPPSSGLVLWDVTSCDLVDPRFSLFLSVLSIPGSPSASIHTISPSPHLAYPTALKIKATGFSETFVTM
jgi:hypothetical protein